MIEAMSPEEDLGVRLAASNALKQAIDDFQFNPEEFSHFLEPVFTLLFLLLKEVNECDTKVYNELAFIFYSRKFSRISFFLFFRCKCCMYYRLSSNVSAVESNRTLVHSVHTCPNFGSNQKCIIC